MKTNKLLLTAGALFAALALSLTGCKKDEGLKLSNNYVTLAPGATYSVTVTSGSTDVTSQATWAVANTEIATINAGTLTGVAEGQTNFTATYNGSTVTGRVIVEQNLEVPAISEIEAAGITAKDTTLVMFIHIPQAKSCNGLVARDYNVGEYVMTQWKETSWFYYEISTADHADATAAIPFKVCLPLEDSKSAAGTIVPNETYTDGSWTTQATGGAYTILSQTPVSSSVTQLAELADDYGTQNQLKVYAGGYLFVNISAFNGADPCSTEQEADWTLKLNVPSCITDGTQLWLTGDFEVLNGQSADWAPANQAFPATVTSGVATWTVRGLSTNQASVVAGASWDYQVAHLEDIKDETGAVTGQELKADANYTFAQLSAGITAESFKGVEGCPGVTAQ